MTTDRRYPDPSIRVLDPRFNALRLPSASVECLYLRMRASRKDRYGSAMARYVLWSDIPNNRILR